jgi:hypothetical protein
MVRMAWKLRREGGGVKADEEGVGRTFTYFFFRFSYCLAATEIMAAMDCTTTET